MKRNMYFSSIPTFSFKVVEGQNLRNETFDVKERSEF